MWLYYIQSNNKKKKNVVSGHNIIIIIHISYIHFYWKREDYRGKIII